MLRDALQTIVTRELRAVKRELDAYPDEASVWRPVAGTPNSGGTLALHIVGNLRHNFAAILGREDYKRDRDAEFSRRNVSRQELVAGLDAAIASVERALQHISDDAMALPYPEPIAKRVISTHVYLVHLATHLAYHLGQIDYHRRAVTADALAVDAVSVRELPEVS